VPRLYKVDPNKMDGHPVPGVRGIRITEPYTRKAVWFPDYKDAKNVREGIDFLLGQNYKIYIAFVCPKLHFQNL